MQAFSFLEFMDAKTVKTFIESKHLTKLEDFFKEFSYTTRIATIYYIRIKILENG